MALEKKDKLNKGISQHRDMITNAGSPDGMTKEAAPLEATLEASKQESILYSQDNCNALMKK